MDEDKLYEFCNMFQIRLDERVQIADYSSPSITDLIKDTATYTYNRQAGYRLTISERQLERLISMLTNKGYYHDEDYTKRLREEELILSRPELKRMHDEYKMLLYMLCGDEWRDG
jgi:DNA invertase Pin-like site-specific DNA recombinase